MTVGTVVMSRGARWADPARDVRVVIALLPLWWALGLDQFVWPIAVGLLILKAVMARRHIPLPTPFALGASVLLFAIAASATMVSDGRELTYVRNLSVYGAGIGLAVLAIATHSTLAHVVATVRVLVITFGLVTLAGALGSLGLWFEFSTPMARFVGALGPSEYVSTMVNKSFVHAEALWFADGFLRPRGLMMFPNILGGVAALSLGAKLLLRAPERPTLRVLWFGAALLDAGVIVATLSRSTWLAFMVGLAVVLITSRATSRERFSRLSLVGLLAGALVVSGGIDIVLERAVERGHSNEIRLDTYVLTLDAAADSFATMLVGHGTQQTAETLRIPLGSHSTYLGLFFKYGVLGLVGFSVVLWSGWLRALRMHGRRWCAAQTGVPAFVLFAITFFAIQFWFIEVDVDAAYSVFFWLILSLSFALVRIERSLRGANATEPARSAEVA